MAKIPSTGASAALLTTLLLGACDDCGGVTPSPDSSASLDATAADRSAIDASVADRSATDAARADAASADTASADVAEVDAAPPPGDVTAWPARIDDVLTNPGMGFADFHFGWWCNLPPVTFTPEACAARVLDNWPDNYPAAGTAYFRWHWRDLEPVRGQIDFDMIDAAILSANQLGETLSFRVMTIAEGDAGVPDWLMTAPYDVAGEWRDSGGGSTFWPDYRDQSFLDEHARLISALGQRYGGHPAVDHVDVGSVGCWGEWNTACLSDGGDIIEVYAPQDDGERDAIVAAFEQLIDHHLDAFLPTPVVMLGIGTGGGRELDVLIHATQGGAGWRVDCWGDWGIWGSSWNHQDDLYPAMIANATAADPSFPDLWQQAPIQLEVCSTLPGWHDLGWTTTAPDGEVHKTFQWALEQHASVLNAKSTDIPLDYVAAIDELLVHNGYRFTLDSLNHASAVTAGDQLTLRATWSNLGVAPSYHRRAISYRLRGAGGSVTFESSADIRTWLPGSWDQIDSFTLPSDLPAGSYTVEVALLDRAGTTPDTAALPPLQLGMEGRGADGWYVVSQLSVE